MAYTFAPTYEYLKGMIEAQFFDTANGNLRYYTNKLQDTNVTSSVNMGEITAGIGNGVVITIPDSATLSVDLTEAAFSLVGRGLQAGQPVTYNGIHEITEVVVASSSTITLPSTAVRGLGDAAIYAYVGTDGTAYTVTGNAIDGFTATPGDSYCVRYNIMNPSATQLDIKSVMTPDIVRAVLKYPAYSTSNADALTGSLSAYYYVIIPRMQFGGNVGIEGNQTTPSTTSLAGTALTYDDAADAGVCVSASMPHLAYIVRVPVGDTTQSIMGLAIVGGEVNMTAGDTMLAPVKFVMPDGSLIQPDYSLLSFEIPAGDSGIATVAADGTITAVGAGSTEITIKLTADEDIKTVNDVEVAAAS